MIEEHLTFQLARLPAYLPANVFGGEKDSRVKGMSC